MQLPTKKPFVTTKQTIIETLLSYINRSRYQHIHHEFDDLQFMADTIAKHAKVPCTAHRGHAHAYLPSLSQTLFKLHMPGRTLSASSTEFDDALSKTKAKAEALERISAYLPLGALANRENRTLLNTIRRKQRIVKSLLGLRFKKVRNDALYYGFRGATHPGQVMSTNGCAGHFSWDTAVLTGLLELVERDAFLVYWLNTISPTRIEPDASDLSNTDLNEIIRKLQMYRLEYHFLDITSDIGIPTCACVIGKSSDTGMRYFVGSAAGFSLTDTLVSAALEALSVMGGRYELQPHALPSPHEPFSKKSGVGHKERMRLYFTDEMNTHFKFFISSPHTVSASHFLSQGNTIDLSALVSATDQLAYVTSVFRKRYAHDARWDVFVHSFHNPLINTFDFYVVRVTCDALYDMYFDEYYANPEHPRLKEFVTAKKLARVATVNMWPHPFP